MHFVHTFQVCVLKTSLRQCIHIPIFIAYCAQTVYSHLFLNHSTYKSFEMTRFNDGTAQKRNMSVTVQETIVQNLYHPLQIHTKLPICKIDTFSHEIVFFFFLPS